MSFKPGVAQEYWDAIQANDVKQAAEVIEKYEWPFSDIRSNMKGGFDAGVHGTLELFGIAGRWRRKPYYSLNDEEMEQLAEMFKQASLL